MASASLHESEILKACRTLFGPDVLLDRNFLTYIQPGGVKSAFRVRAKETHPDRFADNPRIQRRQAELFHDLMRAYELVGAFLTQREQGLWAPPKSASTTCGPVRDASQPRRRSDQGSAQAPRPHQGPLQGRTYQLGMYLYSHGFISYRALIEALVWQRRQRPPLGETAQRWGWLDETKIRSILAHRGTSRRFGEKAIELGFLTAFQVRTLLYHQRSQHQRLGQYFVEKGYLSHAQIDQLAREMQEHNARVKTTSSL